MSTGEVESQYAVQRLNDTVDRVPYGCRLGVEPSTENLLSSQNSYYQMPASASQSFFPSESAYYSPSQSPYTEEHSRYGREMLGLEGDYNVPNPMPYSRKATSEQLAAVPDLKHGTIPGAPDAMASNPTQSDKVESADALKPSNAQTPSGSSPRRSTRSGKNTSTPKVISNKTAAVARTGYDGQPQKVARVCKAPRKRKPSGAQSDKPKVPKLTQPLSELTKDYHHLPVRNMDSWVQRPPEVRWAEVEKRGGYVTRPMNSFMLYRSAYAERTKLWCLQNNHQVVSSVSGESWPLEPLEIREKYNELAKIERVNHQAAHPGYKFSPSKAPGSKKRKGLKREGDTESISDMDYTDVLDDGYGTKPRKSTKTTRPVRGNDPRHFGYLSLALDNTDGGAHRSSFTHNNPGRTPPVCMGTADLTGQYYQTTVRANSVTPMPNLMPTTVIEDVTIHKTPAPGSAVHLQHIQTATGHDDSMHMQVSGRRLLVGCEDNSKVDPALLKDEKQHTGFADSQYRGAVAGLCHQPDDEANFLMEHFEIEPLFATSSSGLIADMDVLPAGSPVASIPRFETSFLEAGIDIQKLPGYDASMQDFLDTHEPWSVTEEGFGGEENDQLCYDEWLQ